MSALDDAVVRGDLERVARLVDEGADINAPWGGGNWTPLHYAVEYNRLEVAEYLIRKGCLLEERDSGGKTPLLLAANRESWDLVELLIASGADSGATDNIWGCNILHYAAKSNKLEVVRMALESGKIDINMTTQDGRTALMLAVQGNHRDVVNVLLASGADIAACDRDNWNVLHYAARWKNLEIVRMALESSEIDINSKSKSGETALMLAVQGNHSDVVNVLLASGADIAACDRDNQNVLHYAALHKRLAIAQVLLQRGGLDMDAKTTCGDTAILIAAKYEDWAMFEQLQSAGGDMHVENDTKETALLWVIKSMGVNSFRLLFNCGAYLEPCTYRYVVVFNKLQILGDAELCTASILNIYNEKWLPSIYGKLGSPEGLPRIESLKIYPFQNVAKEIEKCVSKEIGSTGFCRVLDARPLVLKWLCARSLAGHLSSLERPAV